MSGSGIRTNFEQETGNAPSTAKPNTSIHDRIIVWFGHFSKRWEISADLTRFCLVVLTILLLIDAASVLSDVTVTLLREWNRSLVPMWLHGLRLDTEYGLWANIGYAKLLCAFLLLADLFARTRLSSYGLLALIFLYLTLDDALLFHEGIGDFLASITDLSGFGTISQDHIGELVYLATVGPIVVATLVIANLLAPPVHRINIRIISMLVLGIGFFAVFIDFVDQIVAQFSRIGSKLMGLLDDGGENAAVSLAIAFLIMIRTRLVSLRS